MRETDAFLDACIDSAVQKTVIGRKQAKACCDFANVSFELRDDTLCRTFAFGTQKYRSIGVLPVRLPINDIHFIELIVDVVDLHIPFLLRLDTMERFKLVLYTNNFHFSSKSEGWEVSLNRKGGHLY